MTKVADFLDMLICPLSKATLVLDGATLVSTDPETRRRYRIDDDDVPVLLVDESEELDRETWSAIMERHGVAT